MGGIAFKNDDDDDGDIDAFLRGPAAQFAGV